MCGYAGIIGKNKDDISKEIFSLLNHRGPDRRKYISDHDYSIWHTTLEVQSDFNSNIQPLETNKSILAYNGELFNKEVKNFNSDTDFLFYSLNKAKNLKKILSSFLGYFSFIYFDKKLNKLFLARDIFGSRPLFYTINNKNVIFGSSIDSVIKLMDKKVNFDDDALVDFIERGHFTDSNTFFKEIKSVKPGSFITINIKSLKVSTEKFNNYSNFKKYHKADIYNSLKSSVRRSLTRKNIFFEPYLALSAGIDSNLIRAIALREDLKLSYITGYNVKQHLEKVSKTNYINISINISSELKSSPEIPFSGNPSIFYFRKLAKFVKTKGSKILISGTGADEFFGGYRRNIILKFPNLIKIIKFLLPKTYDQPKNLFNFSYKYKRISSDYLDVIRHYKIKNSTNAKKSSWTYSKSINYEKNVYLTNELCSIADQGCMFEGVESRSPFLDQALVGDVIKNKWNKTFINISKINLRFLLLKLNKSLSSIFLPKRGMTVVLNFNREAISKIFKYEKLINSSTFSYAIDYLKKIDKNEYPVFLLYRLLVICHAFDQKNKLH